MSRSLNTCGWGLHRSPAIELMASTNSEPIPNRRAWAMPTTSDSRTPGFSISKMSWYTPSTIAQAWVSSTISSGLLISRARIMACWPSTTGMPAACRARNTAVSARSSAELLAVGARLAQGVLDLGHRPCVQAGLRTDGALQPGVAPHRVLGVVQVGQLQAVGLGRRAEVPDLRAALPGDQREALALVERPVPDLGGGGVPDVRRLEQQHRAQVELVEHRPDPGEPVLAQPLEVDPVLPVHPHDAGGRAGGDGELSHDLLLALRS